MVEHGENKMIYLYANGNSENHGCEALSVTIPMALKTDVEEYAVNVSSPQAQKYNSTQKELERKSSDFSLLESIFYKCAFKLKLHQVYYGIKYKNLIQAVNKNDICVSIGGDNYCYGDITWLQVLNKKLSKKSKTVLFGQSIEEELLKDKKVLCDLRRYSLIIARESFTYDALCKKGMSRNTVLFPDTAFILPAENCDLPEQFYKGNTVGINISPTIIEACSDSNAVFDAYVNLIRYILDSTDFSIVLIPHVIWDRSDDRKPLKKLYEMFKHTSRLCMIEDHNCMQLKYIISQCRFFIAARTHASIAAYSSYVPTLVVGYSVKAKGIAYDLFGKWEKYVVSAQELNDNQKLVNSFKWLLQNETIIRCKLEVVLPDYINRVYEIDSCIKSIS